jgi:hypothetical protein
VEREKRVRSALEARVEQAVEDAEGLREWAAAQVEGVRRDVEEEVELLLGALGRKAAALEDAQARLTQRVRWGVALLEARTAAVLARRVLAAWRARAARARYARAVQVKLQQRAGLRAAGRALEAWADLCEERRERQQRLRQAVRRMAFLKLDAAFCAWRGRAEWKRQQVEAEAATTGAVAQHMQAWHARRVLGGWRRRARRSSQAGALLEGMARRAGQHTTLEVFAGWRRHAAGQAAAVASFTAHVAAGRRQAALWAALDGWRLAADDSHGERMQVAHAARVMARQRALRVLQAWSDRAGHQQAERQRWRQVEALQRQRAAARALAAWRGVAADRRDERHLVRRCVHARAERRMRLALHFWRCYAHSKRRTAAVLQHSVNGLAATTCARALDAWRREVAAAKVARHRVAMCQRRQRTAALRGVFAAWKERTECEAEERRLVQLCLARADARRLDAAVDALRAHAQRAAQGRAQAELAAGWHAGQVEARALWALGEAVDRRRELVRRLAAVAAAQRAAQLRDVLAGWLEVAGQAEALRLDVEHLQRRRSLLLMKSAFRGWAGVLAEGRWERVSLARLRKRRCLVPRL